MMNKSASDIFPFVFKNTGKLSRPKKKSLKYINKAVGAAWGALMFHVRIKMWQFSTLIGDASVRSTSSALNLVSYSKQMFHSHSLTDNLIEAQTTSFIPSRGIVPIFLQGVDSNIKNTPAYLITQKKRKNKARRNLTFKTGDGFVRDLGP